MYTNKWFVEQMLGLAKGIGEQMQGLPQAQGLLNALKMGHCAPTVMRTLQELQGVEDERILRCTAGLPGGIGWMRSECGCVTSPIMILGLRYGEEVFSDGNGEIPKIIPIGQRYLNRFKALYGGIDCKEIAKLDYNDKEAVKTYTLGAFLPCFRAICGGPGLLMDLIKEDLKATPPDMDSEPVKAYSKLLKSFREKEFHCSQSVLNELDDLIDVDEKLLRASWGFLGGTLLQGMTCGALTAGVLSIGLKFGDIEDSYGRVLMWMLQLFIDGDIKREDLNKFNVAINISQELATWFEGEFGNTKCYDLTKIDFNTRKGVDRYLSENKLDYCRGVVEKTANKVREIIKERR